METQNDSKGGYSVSPREVEMIRFRDGKVPVTFKLMTDEEIEGVILWFDNISVHIVQDDLSEVTVMNNVISMYGRR
ncbi:MAG TPA: hypothetical protein VGK19_17165 [Capsulimonadaceae bacterium]|jgi:hypothetical protein